MLASIQHNIFCLVHLHKRPVKTDDLTQVWKLGILDFPTKIISAFHFRSVSIVYLLYFHLNYFLTL